jgi:hypothetical protein
MIQFLWTRLEGIPIDDTCDGRDVGVHVYEVMRFRSDGLTAQTMMGRDLEKCEQRYTNLVTIEQRIEGSFLPNSTRALRNLCKALTCCFATRFSCEKHEQNFRDALPYCDSLRSPHIPAAFRSCCIVTDLSSILILLPTSGSPSKFRQIR